MKPKTSPHSLNEHGVDRDSDHGGVCAIFEQSHHVRVSSSPILSQYSDCFQRRVLVDSLLNAAHGRTPISSISSLVLFGTSVEWLAEPNASNGHGPPSHNDSNSHPIVRTGAIWTPKPDTDLHNTALRNVLISLRHVHHVLSSGGNTSSAEKSLIYRDLTIYLRDAGNLLATSEEPQISLSLVDTPFILFLSIHLLATCATGILDLGEEEVLESVTHLYGGFLSSYCGIQELAHAFEDLRLERAWLGCLFHDVLPEINFVTELRSRPGVMSWAEEIQRASHDMDYFPSVILSKLDVGIATVSFLDSWRTSQIIIQLQLTNIDQIRRHSDIITSTCVGLSQLCAYDCGREVSFASICYGSLQLGTVRGSHKHSLPEFSHCTGEAFYVSIYVRHCEILVNPDLPYGVAVSVIVICSGRRYAHSTLPTY
jgi:hypothetical protein